MPTYDYVCKSCSHAFELFQSMKDAPKRKCPECGKNTLERLIGTGAAVMFKGSGFYETDYRSESYKKAKAADTQGGGATDKAPSDKPADAKAESKPEPKAEAKAPAQAKPAANAAKSESSKGGGKQGKKS